MVNFNNFFKVWSNTKSLFMGGFLSFRYHSFRFLIVNLIGTSRLEIFHVD